MLVRLDECGEYDILDAKRIEHVSESQLFDVTYRQGPYKSSWPIASQGHTLAHCQDHDATYGKVVSSSSSLLSMTLENFWISFRLLTTDDDVVVLFPNEDTRPTLDQIAYWITWQSQDALNGQCNLPLSIHHLFNPNSNSTSSHIIVYGHPSYCSMHSNAHSHSSFLPSLSPGIYVRSTTIVRDATVDSRGYCSPTIRANLLLLPPPATAPQYSSPDLFTIFQQIAYNFPKGIYVYYNLLSQSTTNNNNNNNTNNKRNEINGRMYLSSSSDSVSLILSLPSIDASQTWIWYLLLVGTTTGMVGGYVLYVSLRNRYLQSEEKSHNALLFELGVEDIGTGDECQQV
ncbi:hypothetical protein RFI_31845 [Reticulomyxa filosa]|uniref:Uncharacterized protein n=1 Tax=Reticulomyxa filosa TaxID=46433 RepID=X6LW01_RETFI|nr:hypothetical protein RFI_31845 [Reticulomyxa filosa]|eukprot:ETO05551.1 hypothetical protein RFI_31845 [Reticulomyxa filosa]